MDEVFGEENFVAIDHLAQDGQPERTTARFTLSEDHDYVLVAMRATSESLAAQSSVSV